MNHRLSVSVVKPRALRRVTASQIPRLWLRSFSVSIVSLFCGISLEDAFSSVLRRCHPDKHQLNDKRNVVAQTISRLLIASPLLYSLRVSMFLTYVLCRNVSNIAVAANALLQLSLHRKPLLLPRPVRISRSIQPYALALFICKFTTRRKEEFFQANYRPS